MFNFLDLYLSNFTYDLFNFKESFFNFLLDMSELNFLTKLLISIYSENLFKLNTITHFHFIPIIFVSYYFLIEIIFNLIIKVKIIIYNLDYNYNFNIKNYFILTSFLFYIFSFILLCFMIYKIDFFWMNESIYESKFIFNYFYNNYSKSLIHIFIIILINLTLIHILLGLYMFYFDYLTEDQLLLSLITLILISTNFSHNFFIFDY